MKTRQAFYLHTTKLTRIARRLCREILRPQHAARHPYMPINSAAIKAECESHPPTVPGWERGRALILRSHRYCAAARGGPEPAGAEAGGAEAPGGRSALPG